MVNSMAKEITFTNKKKQSIKDTGKTEGNKVQENQLLKTSTDIQVSGVTIKKRGEGLIFTAMVNVIKVDG